MAVEATHKSGLLLKNGGTRSDWYRPGPDVFTWSSIFISRADGDDHIFSIFILTRVWALCAALSAKRIDVFSDRTFNDSLSLGPSFLSWLKTTETSHVKWYSALGGCCLLTVRNLEIARIFPILLLEMIEIANLCVFNDPYWATAFRKLARNSRIDLIRLQKSRDLSLDNGATIFSTMRDIVWMWMKQKMPAWFPELFVIRPSLGTPPW